MLRCKYNYKYNVLTNKYVCNTINQPWSIRRKNILWWDKRHCRKDVECAFGSQSRFAIVAEPIRFLSKNDIHDIMIAYIIMHNMIVEDERDLHAPFAESSEFLSPSVN